MKKQQAPLPLAAAHPQAAAVLCLLCHIATSAHALASPDSLKQLVEDGRYADARKLVRSSPPDQGLTNTIDGQLLYAEAICASAPQQLAPGDLDEATRLVAVAQKQLWEGGIPLPPALVRVWWQCRTLGLQVARFNRRSVAGEASANGATPCGQSISPDVVAGAPREGLPLEWVPITPRPPDSALVDGMQARYVGAPSEGRLSVCAPFIAIGPDSHLVCKAALDFQAHFSETYGARAPTAWIEIYHYAEPERLRQHAAQQHNPVCDELLGYYDFRRQRIAYQAPSGTLSTLQRELSHALLFWDLPHAPLWFDEGLAALYERTDERHQALEIPWRVDVLQRAGDSDPVASFAEQTLKSTPSEFLSSPLHQTRGRRHMMRLQTEGKLVEVYRTFRDRSDNPFDSTGAPSSTQQAPPPAVGSVRPATVGKVAPNAGGCASCVIAPRRPRQSLDLALLALGLLGLFWRRRP
jgi:hypothetical protein